MEKLQEVKEMEKDVDTEEKNTNKVVTLKSSHNKEVIIISP